MSFNFACPDWAERLKVGHPLIPELPLLKDDAERAVAIFNKLRLPDVPGQPTLGEAAGEWIRDIVRAIFGSVIDGRRMVREVFTLVPKKQSKTTNGAAISITALLMNARPRADFVYIGPTQEIAARAFEQAAGMIAADEYLAKRFHVAHHTKTITDRRNKAKLKVVTFDMKVATGAKPVFVLLDEIHLMGAMKDAGRVLGQLRSGMLPNPEACMVIITTQSDEAPAGVFKEELEYARGVRDGRIKNARMLPVLYEFPEAMQRSGEWRNPNVWPMVLPNLGRSVSLQDIQAEFEAANEKGEAEIRRWASQLLNVQIGVALASDGWAGAEHWLKGSDHKLTLDRVLERSEAVVVGLDGGGLDDLYGIGVLGREKVTRRWLLWSHALISPAGMDRRKANASTYEDFIKAGDMTLVHELPDDLEWIVGLVERVKEAGVLASVAVDPAGYGGIVEALAAIDVTEENGLLIGVRQGIGLMNAAKTVERKLVDGTLRHSGSGLMAWCAGNAKVKQTPTAMMIERAASGLGKIDPLMAAFDAAAVMATNPAASGGASYLETHELVVV